MKKVQLKNPSTVMRTSLNLRPRLHVTKDATLLSRATKSGQSQFKSDCLKNITCHAHVGLFMPFMYMSSTYTTALSFHQQLYYYY